MASSGQLSVEFAPSPKVYVLGGSGGEAGHFSILGGVRSAERGYVPPNKPDDRYHVDKIIAVSQDPSYPITVGAGRQDSATIILNTWES